MSVFIGFSKIVRYIMGKVNVRKKRSLSPNTSSVPVKKSSFGTAQYHKHDLEDMIEQRIITRAVLHARSSSFKNGAPVAKYDVKTKKAYLIYLDGRIEK